MYPFVSAQTYTSQFAPMLKEAPIMYLIRFFSEKASFRKLSFFVTAKQISPNGAEKITRQATLNTALKSGKRFQYSAAEPQMI